MLPVSTDNYTTSYKQSLTLPPNNYTSYDFESRIVLQFGSSPLYLLAITEFREGRDMDHVNESIRFMSRLFLNGNKQFLFKERKLIV